ncbi:hypothetical protein V7S43_001693 [Phytophthora oleae]|uniref:Uncharacterized protein n=1 Tax=Phytophthora oleae TaxID=2107226 RepID=A0ABD3G6C8_9STRA
METEADADVDIIVDLMESELGPSSKKQDASARTKFNIFVQKHTSMNYLSSIKRQIEEVTATELFRADPEWYRRCRRHLQKQYLMSAISTGKKLKQQAPSMTMHDLRAILTILFLRNDKKALLDRTLLNNQWLAIGRS